MKAIAAALVKAQKEFGPALKTSTNPHFRSRYADLSACVEAVIDALNNNGIYLMQLTDEHEGGVKVSTTFIHESGEQLSGGTLFMPATKHDAQGFGSALSYARRYSLMAACGIAPEEDDGNHATKTAPVAAPKAMPKPVAKTPEAPPPAPPAKMGNVVNQWQLKVSAEPGTSVDDWSVSIADTTNFALEMAQSVDDVNSIYKINKAVYDKLKDLDGVTYSMLLDRFKEVKEKFKEKENEYVPE
jgi:hypothetical protein